MPASIHPPVQLHLVLDERSYEEGGSLEMARRFTAIAPTEVVRASKGSQRANVLRFDVGDDVVTGEGELDPLWRDALATWLDEEFAETSAIVARENDARARGGQQMVPFTWAEVKFGAGPVIAIRMKDSAIPPEAAGFVARARTLLASNAFGGDPIAAIRIPACVSIAAQRADAGQDVSGEERERRIAAVGEKERGSSSASDIVEAAELAAGMDDEPASGAAAADPDEQNAWAGAAMEQDGPSRRELDEAIAEAEAALRRGDDPTDAASEERDARPSGIVESVRTDVPDQRVVGSEERPRPLPDDPARRASDPASDACALADEDVPDSLDYRIWNVAYADGTSVRYDSVLGEALLD
ncbi:hypothetical protein [Arabiibacter massiliensis]|uniref:hypothetical protein n=1 Tax=Arabiibacter massiliensis TaxID=1870985 RepID=UPI0009B98235|nr:hypothetical protein [Arabiibacter massiliensis]